MISMGSYVCRSASHSANVFLFLALNHCASLGPFVGGSSDEVWLVTVSPAARVFSPLSHSRGLPAGESNFSLFSLSEMRSPLPLSPNLWVFSAAVSSLFVLTVFCSCCRFLFALFLLGFLVFFALSPVSTCCSEDLVQVGSDGYIGYSSPGQRSVPFRSDFRCLVVWPSPPASHPTQVHPAFFFGTKLI